MSHNPEVRDLLDSHTQIELRDVYATANKEVLDELSLEISDRTWNENVSDVIVVLCASRSGSSLIFNALASSGRVAAPGGEHEPWLTLSHNKYPFTDSDEIYGDINNEQLLLDLIRNDLLVRDRHIDSEQIIAPLRNRLVIRRQQDDIGYMDIIEGTRNMGDISIDEWGKVIRDIGKLAVKPMPTNIDEFGSAKFGLPLENPPLIEQPLAHIAADEELRTMPLLFKSPSDAYRPGFYENLFPNATINYIHLSRGYVQTANGLMDGWQKDDVDFISNPVGVIDPLNIEDYSITDMTRAYWCFDLFKGWEDYTDSTLIEVCTQQWLSAHRSITDNFPSCSRLTFEEFYTNPDNFYRNLSEITGIDTQTHDWSKSIMSTEPPSQMRWLKRSSMFRNLDAFLPGNVLRDVIELQDHLGYGMDEDTWH